MKPIELNTEQEDKLIKITKELFPEYTFSWEYDMYGRVLKSGFNNVLAVYDKNKQIHFNIHWFEFCFTYLQSHILNWGAEELSSETIDKNTHPVDYLYKQFKKLK